MDTVTSGGEDAAEATAALYASDAVSGGHEGRGVGLWSFQRMAPLLSTLSTPSPLTPPPSAPLPSLHRV